MDGNILYFFAFMLKCFSYGLQYLQYEHFIKVSAFNSYQWAALLFQWCFLKSDCIADDAFSAPAFQCDLKQRHHEPYLAAITEQHQTEFAPQIYYFWMEFKLKWIKSLFSKSCMFKVKQKTTRFKQNMFNFIMKGHITPLRTNSSVCNSTEFD